MKLRWKSVLKSAGSLSLDLSREIEGTHKGEECRSLEQTMSRDRYTTWAAGHVPPSPQPRTKNMADALASRIRARCSSGVLFEKGVMVVSLHGEMGDAMVILAESA